MSERNINFDEIIDRKGTRCLKYDFAVQRGLPEDVLPLWVADMDFKVSSYIEDALIKQANHGIYGYTQIDDDYFSNVKKWVGDHYKWDVQRDWFHFTPGVVFAIANAIRAITQKGDSIIIQQPVYYPFAGVIRDNGRKIISNDLLYDGKGHYSIDFDDFETKIVENDVKLFILCNPHNPVGRVWNKEELVRLGNICKKHNVIVFSDEIHADFVWNREHTVFASLNEEFADFTITATSPSKTFNLAGLQISHIFIPNRDIYKKFATEYDRSGYCEPNAAGAVAAYAAYQDGEEWYQAMKKYVRANIDFTRDFIEKRLPQLRMIEPEGTYLIWIDFNGLNLGSNELEDLIINKAKLWLDSGKIFGKPGMGFQRINAACPRATLEEALVRIESAVSSLEENA